MIEPRMRATGARVLPFAAFSEPIWSVEETKESAVAEAVP